MFILGHEERGRIIHMVRIFVVKGKHEARPRQKSTVLWMVITTGLQSGQDFGRLVRAYGWGEGLGEGRGGDCLNRDTVVRRTLVGGTANFLQKGIQSLGNFGFQGSQNLKS